MKCGIRFREMYFGADNSNMNDRILNKAQRNEVRTAMKDGFRRSSGTLRFAHLAVMAFVLMLGVAGLAHSADNDLLHNSNRFACSDGAYQNQTDCTTNGGTWDPDRRYAGGWGTAGGQYGEFTCNTCHAKGSGNIKRITQTVTTPSGTIPGSAQTVTLSSTVDGSANFDETAGNHAASNKICEVCHTYNAADPALASPTGGVRYHGYNMTGATAGNQVHQLDSDCIKCHQHKTGFRASCTSCHGNPPINNAELVYYLDPGNDTGSRDWGKHDKHVNILGYDCNTCHTGWETSGQMPRGGDINIGFNALGDTIATYDGRTIISGAVYTNQVGTTVNQTGTLTCSAIYCHGSASPSWTAAATAPCGSCHGDATGAPLEVAGDGDLSGLTSGTKVGKHAAHLQESTTLTGTACNLCHNGATHVNGGGAEVIFHASAGTVTYVGGSCLTNDCHGDAVWDSSAAGGCNFCHDYPPNAGGKHASGVSAVNHDKLSPTGVFDNHDECSYCHGVKGNPGLTAAVILDPASLKGVPGQAYVWATDHRDGKVTMNGDTDANTSNDAGYNTANAGCSTAACHANDASHELTTGGAGNVTKKDFGPGACATCHGDATKAATVPQVGAASSHVKVTKVASYGDCTDCHSGHYTAAGGVQIPSNATVGINYIAAGHGGIKLGGPGTNALISGKTTEAEICWACHTADGINEFGLNTDTNGAAANYNYGTLSNNAASAGGWYNNISVGSESGATWTSAVGDFSYKTSAIKSTHSANAAGTALVSGTAYSVGGMNETLDAVANIRCSYCHDVHDLNRLAGDASTGKPWLRGTWKGNPYNEDGAPQLSHAGSWTTQGVYNQVPRASASTTNNGGVGGYWIDQNSGNPNNGATLATTAGLCVICHSSNVDTMDYTPSEAIWVGTNGHSAAVIGGTGSAAANIFTYAARGGTGTPSTNTAGNTIDVQMGRAAETNRGYSYRGNGDGGYGYWPQLVGSRPYAFHNYAWGANADDGTAPTISAGTTALPFNTTSATPVANYHTFNCGKCHNPHASRLPKLMITNCLDTNHNTWQDNASASVEATTGNRASGFNTAQNCHRRAPAEAAGEGGSGTAYGAGWNKVTPW